MSDKKVVATLGDDFDMDDLAELPSFKSWPTGAYVAQMEKGLERKKVGEHDCVEVVFTLVEVAEVSPDALDTGEELPKIGDKCNTLFMLDNEMGQGKLRDFSKPIKEASGAVGFKAIAEVTKGMKIMLVGKRVLDKGDKDKKFFNPVTIGVM